MSKCYPIAGDLQTTLLKQSQASFMPQLTNGGLPQFAAARFKVRYVSFMCPAA